MSEFLEAFHRELPLGLAMPDDPVGVQVMVEDRELSAVAIAYEMNEQAADEAAAAGAELVIAFHPLIYPSVRRLTPGSRVERTVMRLVQRNLTLAIVHTAFDAHPEGTSALLARELRLEGIRPLVPNPARSGAGMGAIGELPEARSIEEFARMLRAACNAPAVRVSTDHHDDARTIRTVAVLGGSGMSFYDHAVAAGADALVTADVRYHGFHAANDRIPVLDPGHAESERFVVDGIAALVARVCRHHGFDLRTMLLAGPANPVRFVI
ncbi:MAG: Nif3-like dinuclear metal center hexameric protein [Bacteroidetes bacterium]|nr:Nif3-like dinuclear metal center hexameric protein [Bacteroidota bacterium]